MNQPENPTAQLLNDRLDSRLRGMRRASGADLIELQGAVNEIVIIMKELEIPMRDGLVELLSKASFNRSGYVKP